MKVAFLDRDGTINKDYLDEQWSTVKEPVFYADTFDALRVVCAKGYKIIVITNQYLIGEGFITQTQYDIFTQRFLEKLAEEGIYILDIFYCPHEKKDGCGCYKPKPGLIHQALEKYPKIDMAQSFFAGDSYVDEGIAAHFRLPFYQVDYANKHSLLDVAEQL